MRAPKRHRPLLRALASSEQIQDIDLERFSKRVSYVGSPEHKDMPSFAGHPAPRGDASKCPPELANQKETVEEWLRSAVLAGTFSATFNGCFPRYVWHQVDGQYFEARLTNQMAGAYKGYPIKAEEYPL